MITDTGNEISAFTGNRVSGYGKEIICVNTNDNMDVFEEIVDMNTNNDVDDFCHRIQTRETFSFTITSFNFN